MSLLSVLLLLGTGAFAGMLGGLFGIGGGVVIVPVLYAVFGAMGVAEAVQIKLAVGTSLATIIVTSARSLTAHAKTGQVEMALLRRWAPFIAAGAAGGAALARIVPAEALTLIFALGVLLIALQKAFGGQPSAREASLPPPIVQYALAAATGLASALMGIGGGVFGVLILTSFGRSVHRAVATAAGFGLAIAVPGAIGFVLAGQGAPVPPGAVGYVHLVGFATLAVATAVTAPLGARLAHRLSATLLTRLFAIYLLITGLLLIRDVVAG